MIGIGMAGVAVLVAILWVLSISDLLAQGRWALLTGALMAAVTAPAVLFVGKSRPEGWRYLLLPAVAFPVGCLLEGMVVSGWYGGHVG